MDEKIKILFLAANPKDTAQLRLDEEMRAIDQALRQSEFRDKFEIYQHWAVRVVDFESCLLRHRPHIVHFSGHGSVSNEIILENVNGNSQPVSIRALGQLFSVLKDNIRCVVLNACYTEPQAYAIAAHIDCVVGMSKAIGNEAATNFAVAFYQALGYGKHVNTAFDLGCLQIDLENLNEHNTPKLIALNSDPCKVFFVDDKKDISQVRTQKASLLTLVLGIITIFFLVVTLLMIIITSNPDYWKSQSKTKIIIVAPFSAENLKTSVNSIHNEISRNLDQIKNYPGCDIRIAETPLVGTERARGYGKERDALLVIWGQFNYNAKYQTKIFGQIELLQGQWPQGFGGAGIVVQEGPSIEFEKFILQERIARKISYLALAVLGLKFSQTGDRQTAITIYNTILTPLHQYELSASLIQPKFIYLLRGEAFFNRGKAYLDKGDFDMAIEDLENFTEQDLARELEIRALHTLIQAYNEVGQVKKASAALQKLSILQVVQNPGKTYYPELHP